MQAQSSQDSEHWVSSQDSDGFLPSFDLSSAEMDAIALIEANYDAEKAADAARVAVELEQPAYRLSATNLAVYHHRQCDLYLYQSYRAREHRQSNGVEKLVSAAADAQFSKGDIWEQRLFDSLDARKLLRRVDDQVLMSSADLAEFFVSLDFGDERELYVCGVTFNSPTFASEFAARGTQPVAFSIAKPDLLKLSRVEVDGEDAVVWEVIDAKSSTHVKTSHHVQIGFYALCLSAILPGEHNGVKIVPSDVASIWLPPLGSKPQSVPLAHVFAALNDLLFYRLPIIVHSPRQSVSWHFNPLCVGCSWVSSCRANTKKEKRLGMIPNIPPNEAAIILDTLPRDRSGTDIEELDKLFSDPAEVDRLERERPTSIRKVKKRLGLDGGATTAAVLRAAQIGTAQVTKRRTFAFPREEDIAVIATVVLDASGRIETHRADVFTFHEQLTYQPPVKPAHRDIVSDLSDIIHWISTLPGTPPRVQFYTFSRTEQFAIQQHLIDIALSAEAASDTRLLAQVRSCIAALCDGAAVLSTMFQPTILQDLLMDLLGKTSTYIKKAHLQECLRRLGLDPNGKVPELRARLEQYLEVLKAGTGDKANRTLGDLPRIVVLQDEIERLVAIPSPGFWGLVEAVSFLCPGSSDVLSDDDILALVAQHEHEELDRALGERNSACYALIHSIRHMISQATQDPTTLLLNEARSLPTDSFMDLCRHPALRKLGWMAQFEVISRMQELWISRRDGCPDAICLTFSHKDDKEKVWYFHVEEGSLDLAAEGESALSPWILARDHDNGVDDSGIPAENFFDDLKFMPVLFMMGKVSAWNDQDLHPEARSLLVANISSFDFTPAAHLVALQLYPWNNTRFQVGQTFRLTPRLIDFNFAKVMRALLALDWDTTATSMPPYVALLQDPAAFARSLTSGTNDLLAVESRIQKQLRELSSLGQTDATALLLKDSQHKAAQRMITSRLSVVHGPPGTGKTYTIALSLLRMVECDYAAHQRHPDPPRVYFVTAVTHAAIEAFLRKIYYLRDAYFSVHQKTERSYPIAWLDNLRIVHVLRGSEQTKVSDGSTHVYCGTAYQLDNFARKGNLKCDAVIIDEASQMGVGTAALVLRWLKAEESKVVLAGDHLQLGTIVAAQYPDSSPPLFGSILDLIVDDDGAASVAGLATSASSITSSQTGPIVQITENFRLNPDLAEFVSTIYKRRMHAMKSETKHAADGLRSLHLQEDDDVAAFLAALGDAMLSKPQAVITPPQRPFNKASDIGHHPTSLALLTLDVSDEPGHASYESHVRCEADIAARLINRVREALPNATIFVATPHRVQRTAVNAALAASAVDKDVDALADAVARVNLNLKSSRASKSPSKSPAKSPSKSPSKSPPAQREEKRVTVDTVERLQGQEADVVICCLAHTHRPTLLQDLNFLFQRRRLNVAISRAKMLCIVISSRDVLRPPIQVLADPDSAQGYKFLRAYEERAWTGQISV